MRRRPALTPTNNVAKKFEEVACIKKQVGEALLKMINTREEREKEEHVLKMEILKLEVEKKKKECSRE